MPGKIATWASTQRYNYKLLSDQKKSNMTLERIELLKAIGFPWCVGQDTANDLHHTKSPKYTIHAPYMHRTMHHIHAPYTLLSNNFQNDR